MDNLTKNFKFVKIIHSEILQFCYNIIVIIEVHMKCISEFISIAHVSKIIAFLRREIRNLLPLFESVLLNQDFRKLSKES